MENVSHPQSLNPLSLTLIPIMLILSTSGERETPRRNLTEGEHNTSCNESAPKWAFDKLDLYLEILQKIIMEIP
jgi:hypothetical protein